MAINRAQLVKELEPGLNALFGLEYARYPDETVPLFEQEGSDRAFEEEVLLEGFGEAVVKAEGGGVTYDAAAEAWTARYQHETIALAFSLTEEAIEDNLYDKLAARYTKALARSMIHTKNVKGASIFNNAFSTSYLGGDGKPLIGEGTDAHPLSGGGTLANEPTTATDLNETALENAYIAISKWTDEKGLQIAIKPTKLCIPTDLAFVAERILKSNLRVETADNDINALRSKSAIPGGYEVNHYFTDTDAWFLKTDAPNCLKRFNRVAMKTGMEGDFETGNVRYKARERYSFGWSDWRGVYGCPGAA
jgi:hypothetical protein